MKNKLIKLALIACLILPTMIFVACGKKETSKAPSLTGIKAYYVGEEIVDNDNTLYIEYDKVNNFAQNLVVELKYSNNETQTINLKEELTDGYVLNHYLPDNVDESYIGETFNGFIEYSNYSIDFSIYIDKKSDHISITNVLNKTYNGDTVASPLINKLNPNAATIEWYTSNGQKLNSAPINAGSYYVKVTTTDSASIKGATAVKTFAIAKAPSFAPKTPVINGLVYSPTRTLADIEVDSAYTWKDPTIVPTCDITSYKATYNPDPANYLDAEAKIIINLLQAEYTVDGVATLEDQYSDIVTKAGEINLPQTDLAWEDSETALIKGYNTINVVTIPRDEINYKPATQTVNFYYYIVLENLPEFKQSSFVYDGEAKTVELGNYYNPDCMGITNPGNTTKTDVGEYKVMVQLSKNSYYYWKDSNGYTDAVELTWVISPN